MFKRTMLYLLVAIAIFFITVFVGGAYCSAPKYSGPVTENFDGRNFINPGKVKAKGLYEVSKWMISRDRGEWNFRSDATEGEKPAEKIDRGIRITFVNHSTFLIQVDGVNILTDPIWSERTSPLSWAGPKRMRPPGIKYSDLPTIHYVLLSHNHYDHLDIETLERIHRDHKPTIVTPLGVKAFLKKSGITNSIDMNWWDETKLNDSITVQSVPAQHFSGRGLLDRDATLWCGYVIKSRSGNIYFGGDTGYNETTFREIGMRANPLRVALIPIGAYKPEWFMSPIHCSPEEAVKIHFDLKAKQSIGMHYGTFPLADDGQYDPLNDLKLAKQKAGLADDDFIVLTEGVAKDF